MFWRVRSYWLAAGAVAYVAFAAIRAAEGHGPGWLALALGPFGLAVAWTLTAPPSRGEDRIEDGARAATRAALTGAAMFFAARLGPSTIGLVALANLGAAIATMAALVALARIAPLGGLLVAPEAVRRLDAVAFASLFWTIAVALPAALSVSPERAADVDPLFLDYATTAASLGGLGLLVAITLRARIRRRFELGVADRCSAALLLTLTALAIGLLAAVVEVAPPERLLPLTAVIASVATTTSVVTQDPTAVARGLRVTLSLAVLGAPIAAIAVLLTHADPRRAAAVVFLACVASILAGLLAPLLARLFAPANSRWIEALESASRAALSPDPDVALAAALLALRKATGQRDNKGAALYRLSPPEIVTIDRAGYSHTAEAQVPERLVALADAEPEGVLRIQVARAVQVRRPEIRPLVAWMDERELLGVSVVRDEEGPIALLSLPSDGRRSALSLEEVQELRALSDRLGAVVGASSALARSRARELAGRAEIERLTSGMGQLAAERDRDEGRRQAIARMLERPARAASYSPAAQEALQQIERLAEAGRPITLLSAPGVDAVAWAAAAHLSSPRSRGPLTLIDGTSVAEHDLAYWRDPASSPLSAASGGSLVLLDAHALPSEVQRYVGAALGEGEMMGIVVSVPATIDALVASGRMSERLADCLGDRAVALPTLEARAEDLRALCMEHLGRIGVRLKERPLGLAPKALAALLEHTWPGNDAELYATLLRAALVAEGDVIDTLALEQIGFPMPRPANERRISGTISIARSRRKSR